MKIKTNSLMKRYTLERGVSNPILRMVCDSITEFTPELKQLAQNMQKLERLHYGT
jgi:hypothetical protein